jgi:L-threonylcarbamoyladenylate synthase
VTAEIRPATDPAAIEAALDALRRGTVVAIPTETVYGLACLPLPGPLERLVAIKRRSADKGIALLIDAVEQMGDFAVVPALAERLAHAFWPGPLTLVLDIRAGLDVPELLTGGRPTIALRLPDHEVPREICRRLGPFAASSANISGQPDATSAQQVMATLHDDVTLILDDGPTRGGLASTVVGVSADRPEPAILRQGAISAADILAAGG